MAYSTALLTRIPASPREPNLSTRFSPDLPIFFAGGRELAPNHTGGTAALLFVGWTATTAHAAWYATAATRALACRPTGGDATI